MPLVYPASLTRIGLNIERASSPPVAYTGGIRIQEPLVTCENHSNTAENIVKPGTQKNLEDLIGGSCIRIPPVVNESSSGSRCGTQ